VHEFSYARYELANVTVIFDRQMCWRSIPIQNKALSSSSLMRIRATHPVGPWGTRKWVPSR